MPRDVPDRGDDGAVHVGADTDARRIDRLERQLGELERDLREVSQISRSGLDSTEATKVMRDAMWLCQKCGTLLGFYDQNTEVLRMRYKDWSCWICLGEGGHLSTICRGCGEVCTQEYITREEADRLQEEAKKSAGRPRPAR